MRWSRFILIVLCASIAFGGSFTCTSKTDNGVVIVRSNPKHAPTSR